VDMINGRPAPSACLRIAPHLVARTSASAPGAAPDSPPRAAEQLAPGSGPEPERGGSTHDR